MMLPRSSGTPPTPRRRWPSTMTPSSRSHAGGSSRPKHSRTAFPTRASLAGCGVYRSKARRAPSRTTSVAHQPGVATMNSTSLRIVGVLLVLGAAWVILPAVLADDATDWANQLAQAQKEREDWQAQLDQAQRDRDQAARDRQEREDWQNQLAQAQQER